MPAKGLDTRADSYQPVLLEAIFVNTRTDTRLILQNDYVESFTVTLVFDGAWTGRLSLFDPTGDRLLDFITDAGIDRRVLLRWGWDDGRGLDVWPQYAARYVAFTPEFSMQGTRFDFELIADVGYLQAFDPLARTFAVGTKHSEVVRAIAASRKWEMQDAQGRSTVEDTVSALDQDLRQEGESDFRFITGKVVPRAVNAKNEGGYRFFVDDRNAVHFHTDFFLPAVVAKTYSFGGGAVKDFGDVIDFAPSDVKFFSAVLGGGAAVFRGVDALSGQRLRVQTTYAGGRPEARVRVDRETGHVTLLVGGAEQGVRLDIAEAAAEASRVQAITAQTQADFERKVAARYDDLRSRSYEATATVRGTHGLLPTYLVRFEYVTARQRRPHPLAGVFRVREIEHEVGAGGWQTRLTMYRLGIPATPGTAPMTGVAPVEVRTAPNDAPSAAASVTLPVRPGA